MNRQIKLLGIALMVLFSALFLQLNRLQVLQASSLAHDPRNTRAVVLDFSKQRGQIIAADGTVLAQSVPTPDVYKYLRQYADPGLYADVTGFFSFTYGTDGAERQFNDRLQGKTVPIRSISDIVQARPGSANVNLTIQPAVQQAAAQALGNQKGAVVALDPRTGAILALYNYPSFDPGMLAQHDQAQVRNTWAQYQNDPAKPLLPRAYRERYAPGSTFKVVTASAAVAQAPDLVTKTYPTQSSLDLPQTNKTLSNFGGEVCGGQMPQLLKVSCNTGFAQVGLDLGAQKLSGQAMAYGFDSRPPVDLPAAAVSNFPGPASFVRNLPALAYSAIGQQDVSASPLQMALVAAAIGNGGIEMTPHILSRVTDDQSRVIETYQPQVWKQPLDPQQAAQVRDMMVGVVAGGTGTAAAINGVPVAGKTGTAQTTAGHANAWFVSFAPAPSPRVAVAVIVENQTGVGDAATGGRVAAPIAKKVLQAALALPDAGAAGPAGPAGP